MGIHFMHKHEYAYEELPIQITANKSIKTNIFMYLETKPQREHS